MNTQRKRQQGCLSLAGVRSCTRYKEIEVSYEDMNFKKQKQKFTGWTAQIIQHDVCVIIGPKTREAA